jgi:hypothetical protein
MPNLLLEKVEYQVKDTGFGVWRRYLYANGTLFREFKSHNAVFGIPLVHYTAGKCPETGKRIVAKGIVAVGRRAMGVVAIGQASLGFVAIGQLAVGILFGLGQAASGVAAIGQGALGALFGLGQLATGVVAIAQQGYGSYVLSQVGHGTHVLAVNAADPAAVDFFRPLIALFTGQ